jgi:hypothetical protein
MISVHFFASETQKLSSQIGSSPGAIERIIQSLLMDSPRMNSDALVLESQNSCRRGMLEFSPEPPI